MIQQPPNERTPEILEAGQGAARGCNSRKPDAKMGSGRSGATYLCGCAYAWIGGRSG